MSVAQGLRLGRLNRRQHLAALGLLDDLWREFDVVEADDVVRRAAELAYRCELRGYDAVHVASAEQLDDNDLVVAAGDRRLLRACADLGMATADTSGG
jgi:uncharacterized protein